MTASGAASKRKWTVSMTPIFLSARSWQDIWISAPIWTQANYWISDGSTPLRQHRSQNSKKYASWRLGRKRSSCYANDSQRWKRSQAGEDHEPKPPKNPDLRSRDLPQCAQGQAVVASALARWRAHAARQRFSGSLERPSSLVRKPGQRCILDGQGWPLLLAHRSASCNG